MRHLYPILLFLLPLTSIGQPLPAPQIFITEVMYHSPEIGSDSLDFIEIFGTCYSGALQSFPLYGFDFVEGINLVFPEGAMIDCGGTVILAKDSVAFENTFGIPALQWDNSSLADTGETVTWINASGYPESLSYDDELPWSQEANGNGASLEYCHSGYIGSTGYNQASNWAASQNSSGVIINGMTIYASPGQYSACVTVDIDERKTNFQFSIYPNPATENLRIESQTPLAHVKLTDLAGRPSVHQPLSAAGTQDDPITMDISLLPSGIYLLEAFTQDGRRSVQKVVVK